MTQPSADPALAGRLLPRPRARGDADARGRVELSRPSTTWSPCWSAFAKPPPGWDSRPLGARVPRIAAHPARRTAAPSSSTSATRPSSCPASSWSTSSGAPVSTDYYMALGRVAYHQLAALAPSDTAARARRLRQRSRRASRTSSACSRRSASPSCSRRRADRARLHPLAAHARPAGRPVAACGAESSRSIPGLKVAALTAAGGAGLRLRGHDDREERVARGLVDPLQLERHAVEDLGALQRVPAPAPGDRLAAAVERGEQPLVAAEVVDHDDRGRPAYRRAALRASSASRRARR